MPELTFEDAFKYSFRRPVGLLNILWVLVPIYGWFLLGGYVVRITLEFTQGKFRRTPKIAHTEDFFLGFWMFLKSLPMMLMIWVVAFIAGLLTELVSPFFALITILLVLAMLFIIPVLSVNFIKKQTVASWFEFEILRSVTDNFGEYIIAVLKSIVLGVIFGILSYILIGLPPATYTKMIFFADFYRKYVK